MISAVQQNINLTPPSDFTTVTCPKLDEPQYGKVSVTGHSYSSVAYYICNYGYELDGSHSRKCQHDGSWYGKAPECRPVKRSMLLVHTIKNIIKVNGHINHYYLFRQLWQT